jgi:hypothetical protein
MTRTETFVALASGILAILGVLLRIAWSMGQFVQRFGDHITQDDRIHADQENRIRRLERPERKRFT